MTNSRYWDVHHITGDNRDRVTVMRTAILDGDYHPESCSASPADFDVAWQVLERAGCSGVRIGKTTTRAPGAREVGATKHRPTPPLNPPH